MNRVETLFMKDQTQPLPRSRPRLRDYLELVKFSHTVFALPFALASMIVAAQKQSGSGLPPLRVVAWILVAMVGARTAAMGFNRIVDRDIDAANPRTSAREIPSGKVSIQQAAMLVALSAALFVFAAYQLNALAFALSIPTLCVLFFYSFCKRFTSFSHVVLGICLGIAPAGAWVAVRAQLELAPIVLALAVLFWVAGFDVIYATMDDEFDKNAGLHSLVQKLGIQRSLFAAKIFHAVFIALLIAFGFAARMSTFYFIGAMLIAMFLIYEHTLVDARDLRRVNAAFFTVNGVISVFFLGVVAIAVFI